MKKYNFDVYEKENGEAPFLEYLDSLDVKSRAKVLRAITIVEDFGVHSPPGYIDHLDDGIYELQATFLGVYIFILVIINILSHMVSRKKHKKLLQEKLLNPKSIVKTI